MSASVRVKAHELKPGDRILGTDLTVLPASRGSMSACVSSGKVSGDD